MQHQERADFSEEAPHGSYLPALSGGFGSDEHGFHVVQVIATGGQAVQGVRAGNQG